MLSRLRLILRAVFRPRRPAEGRARTAASEEILEPQLHLEPDAPGAPGEPAQVQDAAPAEALHDEIDEDEWADEEVELPDDEPDPFITETEQTPPPSPSDLRELRAAARTEALSGEHRLHLHSPAGPGSLGEALNHLLAEGKVEAEFVAEGEGAPFILYRPAKAPG